MILFKLFAAFVVVSFFACRAATAQPGAETVPKRLTLSQRLAEPVTFDFQKAPLMQILEDLKEAMQIPIYLDTKKMEENAVSLEIPLSGKSSGAPAIDDINALLRGGKLSAEIRLDVLYVSPLRGQKQFLDCHFYRLSKDADAADLTKRIKNQIAATTWRDGGGQGEIVRVAPTAIAISHLPMIHRKIHQKFGKELSLVSAPSDRIAALAPTIGPNPIASVSQALRRHNSAVYAETPFRVALGDWAKNAKLKLEFDDVSLKGAGIRPGFPLTVNLRNMPADSVLTLMLEGYGLDWTLHEDLVFITTPTMAAADNLTMTYATHDLVPPCDNETLVRALQRTLRPATWDISGGAGKISAPDSGLKIKQSVQVHRLIEVWLADLRTAMSPSPVEK